MTCIPTGENSVTNFILSKLGKEWCTKHPDAEYVKSSTKGVYYEDLSLHMLKIHLWTEEEKLQMQADLMTGVYGLMSILSEDESNDNDNFIPFTN